jgi:hypothetical protein
MRVLSTTISYLLRGAIVLVELWPPHIFYVRFHDSKFLQGAGRQPHAQPPTWMLSITIFSFILDGQITI